MQKTIPTRMSRKPDFWRVVSFFFLSWFSVTIVTSVLTLLAIAGPMLIFAFPVGMNAEFIVGANREIR